MSHSWTYRLIEKLSDDAKKQCMMAILRWPFRVSHDNINLGRKVFAQRSNSQNRLDSGTAATVYITMNPNTVWPLREEYMLKRTEESQKPITVSEIFDLEMDATPRLREQAIYRVMKFLADAPAFDFATYEFKESNIFSRPPPRYQLPTGPEHKVHQYMLDTVQIESASQEGTRKCLDEWMRQLGLDRPEAELRDHPTFQHLLVWIGDQLTTVRIRSVKKDRSEDYNFVQRLEQFFEVFGWFHAQLAEETSFHKQYYANHTPFGLRHGLDILKRKGLHTTSVKGEHL